MIKVSFSTPLRIFRALSDKLAFVSAGRIEKMVLSVNYIEAVYQGSAFHSVQKLLFFNRHSNGLHINSQFPLPHLRELMVNNPDQSILNEFCDLSEQIKEISLKGEVKSKIRLLCPESMSVLNMTELSIPCKAL